MKKLASFIVEKRVLFFVVMLLVAIASFFGMIKTNINGDMTKYLPDDSSMKKGLDIMFEEFPEMGVNATFKVMFDDLTQEQKAQIFENFKAMEAVDTVSYVKNGADYNRDNHTLYILQTHHKYGTKEEKSIEKALKTEYTDYKMVWNNDNTGMIDIPKWIFVAAVGVLMVILFSMSGSWLEPILFLGVIGIAILMNMGTNIFLGSVSDITYSISAILQLVLSMDYSIILMNRYRQEKDNFDDKFTAMKAALAHAFSSVASSALTTVLGLLMLVFMRFKIGMDIGIVLAKGVFISMVCVLLMLPCIILFFDKAIERSSKKSLDISMKHLAAFSYKARYVLPFVFIALIAGSIYLQNKTNISYIFSKEDKILEVFPASNTMVLVFENEDEPAAEKLTDMLTDHPDVKNVLGYYATLSKEYPAEKLASNLSSQSDMPLSGGLVNMLYYIYNGGKAVQTMTVGQMLKFISETVLKDETIITFLDENMLNSAEMIGRFSEKEALTTPMTAEEIASLFGMNSEDIKGLYLLYFAEKDGIDTGVMTLPEFSDFVTKEVAKDERMSVMFDKKSLELLKMLSNLTDVKKVTNPSTGKEIASLMGQTEEIGNMMMVCYKAFGSDYVPEQMTFPQFASFLQEKVLTNPLFASYIDEETKAQASRLSIFTNEEELTSQKSSEEMSAFLSYEEKQTKQIYGLAHAKTMSVDEMVNFILTNKTILKFMSEEDKAGAQVLQSLVSATLNKTKFSPAEMAKLVGQDLSYVKMLYTLNDSQTKKNEWKASLQNIINFMAQGQQEVASIMGKENVDQLSVAKNIVNGAVAGTKYSATQLANLVGMTSSQAKQLYLLKKVMHGEDTSSWKISISNFINFIASNVVTNPAYASMVDGDKKALINGAQKIISGVISEKPYTAGQMADMVKGLSDQINSNIINVLYLYYSSTKNSNPEWRLSAEKMFDYLVNDLINDDRIKGFINDDTRKMLQDSKLQMEDGKAQLKTDKHSRIVINTTLPDESEETTAFISEVEKFISENFKGDTHLIGNSAMAYEMKQTFRKELLFITLLTIAAIFLIVAITFKSVTIPLILVLLVQCGVYITVAVTGLIYGDILYLALLIVECILMGATIDYGILLTNYYVEARKTMDVKDSLKAAYAGSNHTILTSGLILIIVTAIIGNFFGEPTVQAIIRTISIGALCAVLLILLILPGVLAALDKITIRKKKENK